MESVAVARQAMATRFEVLLYGPRPEALRAAAEEALDEIERLEEKLSFYRRTSSVSRINARAAMEPVRVEPTVFDLLSRARQLSEQSGGAFDITVAPLIRCWGFTGHSGAVPDADSLEAARARVGMDRLALDSTDQTVRFLEQGMSIDFGAIGKGYAVDHAAEVLRDLGIVSALIHGGTSTVYALGAPPEGSFWKIAIAAPAADQAEAGPLKNVSDSAEEPHAVLTVVSLRDEALSVSAPTGKAFEVGGRTYGHVIDPRSGWPVEGALLAAVVLPRATDSDALSTALLVLGEEGQGSLREVRPEIRSLVVSPGMDGGPYQCHERGIAIGPAGDR